ncbi:MAG TPA: glycosyltransferase [Methylocystis sp.]|nr:glycosyltransferase [Methylocystis sp.]
MIKLDIWTPLPPRKSGIAQYNYELLEELAKFAKVRIVCEDVEAEAPSGIETIHYGEVKTGTVVTDLFNLYHLGNNLDHEYVYKQALKTPGVVVLHDMTLHHLIEAFTLGRSDPNSYIETCRNNYGEPGEALARLRLAGVFHDAQRFKMTLNRDVCQKAVGVVVHNKYILNRIKSYSRRTYLLEHHVAPAASRYESVRKANLKKSLGLPGDKTPVVASLGFVTAPKMINKALEALAMVKRAGVAFRYLVVGEKNPGFDLDHYVGKYGLTDEVIHIDYCTDEDFFKYLAVSDLVINLRYPSAGESSGTLARALGMGVPAVVYNFGPFSEFPDDCVFKAPLELGEPVEMSALLHLVLSEKSIREKFGENARKYVSEHCSVRRSVERYISSIVDAYGSYRQAHERLRDWVGTKS